MAAGVKSGDAVPVALAGRFRELYRSEPAIVRAPGRVNLIGEHTDYNDGFVMPAAIDFHTWVAVAPRPDRQLHVSSAQFADNATLSLDELAGPPAGHWTDYIRGVAAELVDLGVPVRGANLLIHSDVPLGAGLSSSAALEVSVALALEAASGTSLQPLRRVKACQKAEHEYAGTRCGIMDQFIANFARPGHALMLDCRSLDYSLVPIGSEFRMVICNSMVKHELATGEYNRRRAECEAGVRALQQFLPRVRALRDLNVDDLARYASELPDVVARRCRHVVTENDRVLAAEKALRRGDVEAFGRLMYESHASLRDDYEVSCPELDLLVELASQCDGVFGARMTGGGFGGCTVNLVRADAADAVSQTLVERYQKETKKTPAILVCSPAGGACALSGHVN